MKLIDLLDGLKCLDIKGDLNIEINKIAYDSRKVVKDSLFICIEGFKTDGHNYIGQAINSGARAIMASKDIEVPSDVTLIKVQDTRFALASVSATFLGYPSHKLNLIGITGTKGKTTSTYMIKAILEEWGQKVGLIGTIQNSIGNEVLHAERTTPEALELQELFAEMHTQGVASCVMEVSSHALDLHRVSFSEFDIGVFTNLSRDHLDFHKTFENYFAAKEKLFSLSKKGLVNIDCEFGRRFINNGPTNFMTYSIDGNADIMARNIELYSNSVVFDVVTPKGEESITINIPGKFTVYNALVAIGVSVLMEVPLSVVKAALKQVKVPGRAEPVDIGKDYTIVIDYAHTPDSLENILTTVKNFAQGRVISIFGCGGDRDRTKRPIMGEISGRIADLTIITADNSRSEEPMFIIGEIEAGIKITDAKYKTIPDRKTAIKFAMENAQTNDVIVLSGKGHETYQIFKDKTIHFDEREVIAEIVEELKKEGKW